MMKRNFLRNQKLIALYLQRRDFCEYGELFQLQKLLRLFVGDIAFLLRLALSAFTKKVTFAES